jgi:tetratricopeptide (TPR) repeat protein
MEELYLTMVPLLRNQAITLTTRLEVELIYHSICGDMQKAEQATDQLLVVVKDERDPRTLSRALCNVGVAYRLAGRSDDAEAVFLELLDLSLAHGLVSRTSFALFGLVRVYLANGDAQRARDAIRRFDALADADQDLHRTTDRVYFLIRLALEEGNIDEAAERYAVVAAQSNPAQSVNWRAAILALGVRIAIQRKNSVEKLRPMIAELGAAHLQNRGSGWQDFETHALALGLRYCGDLEQSARLLVEYVTKYRREKGPLLQQLSDLLPEVQEGYAVSATRRMEPLSGVL